MYSCHTCGHAYSLSRAYREKLFDCNPQDYCMFPVGNVIFCKEQNMTVQMKTQPCEHWVEPAEIVRAIPD